MLWRHLDHTPGRLSSNGERGATEFRVVRHRLIVPYYRTRFAVVRDSSSGIRRPAARSSQRRPRGSSSYRLLSEIRLLSPFGLIVGLVAERAAVVGKPNQMESPLAAQDWRKARLAVSTNTWVLGSHNSVTAPVKLPGESWS